VLGNELLGLAIAVGVSAALFALAHTKQGAIGVGITFLDAVFFSFLRLRYATLWARILAHGFNKAVGLTAFYFTGPIYGLSKKTEANARDHAWATHPRPHDNRKRPVVRTQRALCVWWGPLMTGDIG